MTRILLLGANGQVGWEARRALQPLGDVAAASRVEADFERPDSLRAAFDPPPDVVVNAAAYTAVDQAETDADRAALVNAGAVAVLADEARKSGALLVHYSTDYVFDGTSDAAYREDHPTNPQSVYGRTKRAGEAAIVASGCAYLVLRTSWVFASRGKNFVRTILRLAGEREVLRIVADQHGAPTSARLIADSTAQIVARAIEERSQGRFRSGIFHLTASGRTSWHGLAAHVVERARDRQVTPLTAHTIEAIRSSEYPVPAPRPANSSLDTARVRERFGIALPDWRVGVDLCLDELWAA